MLHDSETEKEILLGNKQLLGIFFVVVVLLAIAFGAGYKIGQGSKRDAAVVAADTGPKDTSTSTAATETHTVPPDDGAPPVSQPDAGGPTVAPETAPTAKSEAAPLGARQPSAGQTAQPQIDTEAPGPPPPQHSHVTAAPKTPASGFVPQPGQMFLQVVAVTPEEAEGIAEVLRKKGFPAHAVPKPGDTKLYRVIVGPIHDAGDLNAKRAALRSTGFRNIFVQRY